MLKCLTQRSEYLNARSAVKAYSSQPAEDDDKKKQKGDEPQPADCSGEPPAGFYSCLILLPSVSLI